MSVLHYMHMVKLTFSAIPEGVPYEQKDCEREIEFEEPDDAVRFLNLQAARSALDASGMGELVFSTLAQRIADGNRYGLHLVKIGEYVPQIVKWSLVETAVDRTGGASAHVVN